MKKTDERIIQVKKYLLENYKNKVISYSTIKKDFADINQNPMSFYRFVYAGVLDTISPAHYKMNDRFENTSCYEVRVLSNNTIAQKRKIREKNAKELTKETPTIFDDKLVLNEINAIALLKRLGYKIMKPTTNFEEI
jgi:hypothetical protein